jgi:EAL domain-containing protein (putative c-di-GMP-specific phosphodiesterase class I)
VITRVTALGRAVRNRWRQSFVTSITLLALLGVVAFALIIGRVVKTQIEDQAFDRATDTAQITARIAFAPRLPAPGQALTGQDLSELDRQLASARQREPLIDMRLWNRDGSVVYSRERIEIATLRTPSKTVQKALEGHSSTAVVGGGGPARHDDQVLVAAVPVTRAANQAPAAALELRLPYGATAEDIDRRARRLYIALAIVALLAYALALPGLIRAGRALRSQYDPRRVEVVRELKQALARDELSVHFQPIVESSTRKVRSAEALVRWEHPKRGPVPPDRFIPVVEPTDVMWPFTLRVLELAIREAKRWRDDGHEVDVAVNVSGEILPDRRLPAELERLLTESGLPAQALEIEVTEGAVMRDPAAATRVLKRITDLGVSVIAIDDFGTGYSSLARLHELPLDTLKIDQSFVMRMASEDDDTVVRSIVELAHALDLTVIAEGVEDEATWARLAEMGSDMVQGYAITRPLPAPEFAQWLAREGSREGILDP